MANVWKSYGHMFIHGDVAVTAFPVLDKWRADKCLLTTLTAIAKRNRLVIISRNNDDRNPRSISLRVYNFVRKAMPHVYYWYLFNQV